jgi:DRTGG domain.
MKLSELAPMLGAQCVQDDFNDSEILDAYTGDLLSDILGNADEGCVIVTIQAHRNTIAVATTKDCPAVIVCNSREIPDDMLSAARQEHIGIFRTALNQFTVSGMLYDLLGCAAKLHGAS